MSIVTKNSKYNGFFLSQLVNTKGEIFYLLPGKRHFAGLPPTLFHGGYSGRVKLAMKNSKPYIIKTGEPNALAYEHRFYQQLGEYSELLRDQTRERDYLIMTYYPGDTLMKVLRLLLQDLAHAKNEDAPQHISSLISLILCVINEVKKMHSLDIIHGDLHIGNIICAVQDRQWSCHIIDPHESKKTNNFDFQVLFGYIASQIKGCANYLNIKDDILLKIIQIISANEMIDTIINNLSTLQPNHSNTIAYTVSVTPSYELSKKQITLIESNIMPSATYQMQHYENHLHRYIKIIMYAALSTFMLMQIPIIKDESNAGLCFYSIMIGSLIEYFHEALQLIKRRIEIPEYFCHVKIPLSHQYYNNSQQIDSQPEVMTPNYSLSL